MKEEGSIDDEAKDLRVQVMEIFSKEVTSLEQKDLEFLEEFMGRLLTTIRNQQKDIARLEMQAKKTKKKQKGIMLPDGWGGRDKPFPPQWKSVKDLDLTHQLLNKVMPGAFGRQNNEVRIVLLAQVTIS